MAQVSDVRWATDATYVWTWFDGLVYVNAVIDCADRECIGLNVSQRNDAREAAWALEDALIRRFGTLSNGNADVILRTDNALVYASELYRSLAKSYGLQQEFILPHTPEQNGVAESFMGTLKLECIWQQRFDTYDAAKAAAEAALISVQGALYGTTGYGGRSGNGAVYRVSTSGAERVLHIFTGFPADGVRPTASLLNVNGTLYGTTQNGGKYGIGTVYSISTSGTVHVLHSFGGGADGQNPQASVTDVNGTLYGTTRFGGPCSTYLYGCGTVFALTP